MTRMIPINHETGQFVHEADITEADEDRISLYPVGPECIKKWRREYGA